VKFFIGKPYASTESGFAAVEGYMAESKIDMILRRVDSMPPLPTTAMKVIEVANDPRSNVSDMDKVIAMDTVFSAKLLKMVYSSYFGLRDKITTSSRAIAHLGMNTLKNLVL
jgi:HD-like signal output (HDOD) protein